ncbi:hypothetical protein [Gracilimonas mengyeensis]|uniref:6-bladed beta-propeller protein n=1 Tax=Gracilimonas mengyeensis TaxID=1302730 RepID=A0A521E5L1_9BACT|nr:hypothetical protein [Gracilimonas mengyeensis]SMO78661.1 hypothetical protein SAMN06265219_110136 [Gracilimonas mengyeensis]
MIRYLAIVLVLLICENVNAQENFIYDKVYNPENIYVVDDSLVLIADLSRVDEELCLVNIYTEHNIGCTRIGYGPGEFSGNVTSILIDQLTREIIIWDGGNQRISTFSSSMELLKESPPAGGFSGGLFAFPLKNGKQLVLRMNRDSFAEIVDENSNSIEFIIENESELLHPIRDNFLLKQGEFATESAKNSIVYVSKYSSTVIKISEDGVDFITLGKPNIPFPEREQEDGLSIPSAHKYITSSLDVSIAERNVYVLHSGKKTSYNEGFWYLIRGRILELQDKLEKGKVLLVYNLNDGSFERSIELPFEAKKAKVYNNKVYALHETKGGPVITVLSLEEL